MFHQDYFARTLRWCEPHGGWGDHHNFRFANDIRKLNNDSGFCNRLLHWELGYIINEKLNNDYKILVQYQHWPEMDLLDLPHTHVDYSGTGDVNDLYWNFDYEKLKFKTVFDVRRQKVKLATPITSAKVKEMFKTQDFTELRESQHWYADFGFETMSRINTSWYRSTRPISKIKLKHKQLENLLTKTLSNVVGIHLRRFNGVDFREEDYESIPPKFREKMKLLNDTKSVVDTGYPYINDEFYFEIMDDMIKENPQQKFYLSTDLPTHYLTPFRDRYGDKILHSGFFQHQFVTYLYNAGIDVKKLELYANVVINVIDLFALATCPFVIGNPHSTWSEFAYYYKPKTFVSIGNEIDGPRSHEIKKMYKEHFKKNKNTVRKL